MLEDQLEAWRATFPNAARVRWSRRRRRGASPGASPRSAKRRACAQGRRQAEVPRPLPSPPDDPRERKSRSVGSIAGGTAPLVDGSSAPPIRSSISGSPIGISRGSSRPEPLARTNASVTARTARLLGSRIRPRPGASGSRPNLCDQSRRQAHRRTTGGPGWCKTVGGPLRRALRHARSAASVIGWLRACRRRTTGPGGPRRSSGPRRSPGPTGCWSRTDLPAHRGAAAWIPSGRR